MVLASYSSDTSAALAGTMGMIVISLMVLSTVLLALIAFFTVYPVEKAIGEHKARMEGSAPSSALAILVAVLCFLMPMANYVWLLVRRGVIVAALRGELPQRPMMMPDATDIHLGDYGQAPQYVRAFCRIPRSRCGRGFFCRRCYAGEPTYASVT